MQNLATINRFTNFLTCESLHFKILIAGRKIFKLLPELLQPAPLPLPPPSFFSQIKSFLTAAEAKRSFFIIFLFLRKNYPGRRILYMQMFSNVWEQKL